MELPERILIVGAHCDDVELFAGGLLAKACRLGREVGVCVLSDHRGVADDARADRAREELAANLEWLAETTGTRPAEHTGLWLPACQGAFEAQRGAIYAALEALRERYDLVVTHAAGDTNQDHQQVAAEARRVFKGHASLLGGEFPANDLGDFRAQVFVRLDEADLAAKVELCARYASQRAPHRPYLGEAALRGLARARGAQVQAAAAEAFEVTGRLILS